MATIRAMKSPRCASSVSRSGRGTLPALKLILLFLSVAVLLSDETGSSAWSASSKESEAVSATTSAPPKVLYLTHSAGFKHQVLPLSQQILKEIGEKSGKFAVTSTEDCSVLSREGLKQFSAVVFYTTGELPISDEQKTAFLDFIKSGKGFVGIHSATDTFYKWQEYGELIGGYFDQHPWHQQVTVNVENQTHRSSSHFGKSFSIIDEIYQFKSFSRDRVRVLLSLDVSSVDLSKPAVHRTDKDFALAWIRNYGRGRVFYTALGHRPEVWQDERFQKHLLGALLWAMG